MKDRLRYFRVEARELTLAMAKAILDLEGDAPDREEIAARLLRAAHTLKGAARVVGEGDIADLAHAFEDAVTRELRAEDVPALLARVDAISARSREREPPPRPEGRAGDLDLTLDAITDAQRAAREVRLRAPRAEAAGGALDALDAALDRAAARAHELRLVPASDAFAELERAAHDTARALGKRVTFEARGGDQHLDRSVLALARDALLHVVQNAVDHGIEPPEERARRGKPKAGSIVIEVARRGHRATFACRDDGRGIDLDAVQRAARGHPRSEGRSAIELVFEPRVSTRSEVSPISGRGVGLDAVREIVARLHGTVSATSEPGAGTTFTIGVPVSLAAMPALIVESCGARAAIPTYAVRCGVVLREGSIAVIGDREAVVTDGRAAPLLVLGAWLSPSAAVSARVALIIEADEGAAALGVDRVIGAERVVVLHVAAIAGSLPVLGASLDATGDPILVLDPSAVIAAARTARKPSAPARPRRRVLIIDDSLTSRVLEQSILASAGFDADVASSGEEGLEKARRTPYDLFVVDVEMAGMDGFQFVARTRADPGLSAVPSIIVSSRASDADKRRGAESGARAWAVKGEIGEPRFLELVRGLSR